MKQTEDNEKNCFAQTTRLRVYRGPLVVVVAAMLSMVGCEPKKKAFLTDAELRQIPLKVRPGEPGVLYVGGDPLTCDEVISRPPKRDMNKPPLREQLGPLAKTANRADFDRVARATVEQRLNSEISSLLFYQRARAELGDKMEEAMSLEAEKAFRQFAINEHGGDPARAEEALRAKGISLEQFKRNQLHQMMSQYYVAGKVPIERPITHREIVRRYELLKDELFRRQAGIQFQLIDIHIFEVKIDDPNTDRVQYVENLARQLVQRAKSGEDFGELAKVYSHGYRKDFGGLWPARDPASLASPWDVLAKEAETAEIGQIVGPIPTGGRLFIMKLIDKVPAGYEPLDAVQARVEQDILLDRQTEILAELESELERLIELGQSRRFVDYCLDEIYNRSRSE